VFTLGAIALISGIAVWSQRRDLSFCGDFVFHYLTCYWERVCPSLCPFLPKTLFLEHPSEKTGFILVFWQGLQVPDGVNYEAKNCSI
jgi:hypothetical protein